MVFKNLKHKKIFMGRQLITIPVNYISLEFSLRVSYKELLLHVVCVQFERISCGWEHPHPDEGAPETAPGSIAVPPASLMTKNVKAYEHKYNVRYWYYCTKLWTLGEGMHGK